VARYGWSGVTLAVLWAVALLVLGPTARAAAAPKPDPKAEAKAPKFNPVVMTQTLNAIVEAQRGLAATLSQLRDQLSETQRSISDSRDEIRQDREAMQASLDQTKGMREEVRGLYVESSGLKGDIAQLGKQVEGLDNSLGGFRLSSGIVVAVIIVLQIVLVGLTFRGRS